jgi:Pup amidohydrolase
MSIPKVVGIEQEYAINVKGMDGLSPFQASCLLVNSYARKIGIREPGVRVLWDYGHETPYRDIRGDLFGKKAGQEIVAEEENLKINAALPNGARFYTDHAHPEYSTPECLSARDVVACDKAGELILRESMAAGREILPSLEITILKNNVDYQGHSYGCHENYLMDAAVHEECFVLNPRKALQGLVPFLVTRQIYSGAGKVGGESPESRDTRFQLSQRADFMEAVFGLETMYARPIVNTRQEHHADPARFRRLHLILGDANMNEFASVLKIGATQLVLQMMEDGFGDEDLTLADPVKSIKLVSAKFNTPLELADGRRLTPLAVQRKFLERARRFRGQERGAPVPDADLIIDWWEDALSGLEQLKLSEDLSIEDDPALLSTKLDWAAKLWLFGRYRKGNARGWNVADLRVLDLQYHNISSDDGIFGRLRDQGLTERILDENRIHRLVTEPPGDTRAYFRAKCIEKFRHEIYTVNWEAVGFDHGEVRRVVPLLDPLRGTRQEFEEKMDRARHSRELLAMIRPNG